MLEIAFLNYEFVFLEGAFPRPSSLHHWQLRTPMKIIVTLTVLVNHWMYNWRGRGGGGVVGTLTNENQREGFHPPNPPLCPLVLHSSSSMVPTVVVRVTCSYM